jgi:hypothetical protein
VRQAKWENRKNPTFTYFFEETSDFQRTFINNYLFIYILRACIHAQKPPKVFSPIRVGSLRALQSMILNQFLGSCDPVYRGLGKKQITLEDYLGSRLQNAPNKINLGVQVGTVGAPTGYQPQVRLAHHKLF